MVSTGIVILLLTFIVLLIMGMPIAYAIGIASIFTMLVSIDFTPAVSTFSQRMATGLNSFTLLAIPFFILAGNIMNKGGIAMRLVEFARLLAGKQKGGLAFVNVISNMLFGAISGSAAASASAIGSIMGPEMKQEGYDENFSAAINITSSTTGLSIPPSNVLIVYSLASGGVSISALFLAGYIPGVLTGLALMIVGMALLIYRESGLSAALISVAKALVLIGVVLLALWLVINSGLNTVIQYFAFSALFSGFVYYQFRQSGKTIKKFLQIFWDAVPSLVMLVLVIGGIIAGVFTATEASAVAVLYTLLLSFFYRELKPSDLPDVMLNAVKTTALVLFLVSTSMALSWIMAYENIPQVVSSSLLSLSDNPIVILLIINLVLLVVGTFMDMTPAILIFTPIFLPVVQSQMGMDPVQFGVILVLNLSIGLCTPPVGSILFVGCSVANIRVEKVIKPLIPMFVAMVLVLLLVTYIPEISLWLPSMF